MPKLSDEDKLERRKKITDTAFELFSERGYSEVSVNDIVSAAGISKGGFYTYFESKQQVFYEILKKFDDSKTGIISCSDKEATYTEKVSKYLQTRLYKLMEEDNKKWVKFSVEFWSTVHNDSHIAKINSDRFKTYLSEIKDLIEAGMCAGEFREDIDIKALVYGMISMIDGAALLSSVMNQEFDEKFIDTAIDLFVSYLIKP